jgi:hypothetical protein
MSPLSKRESRVLESMEWAKVPLSWSVRVRLAPGSFKVLRRVPLWALSRVLETQLLFIRG